MTGWVSKLLAVALAIAVAMSAVFGAAVPLSNRYADGEDEKELLQTQIARFNAAVRAPAAAVGIEVADRVLLEGSSLVLAGAEMQDMVEQLIDRTDAEVQSIQTDPPQPFEQGSLIPLSVDFTCDIDGLRRILHSVETARPYLVISQIDIRRSVQRREAETTDISVRMRLFGFARPGVEPE